MKLGWVFCILLLFLFIPAAKSQIGLKAGIGVSDIVFADEGQTSYLGFEMDYIEHRNPLLSFQLGALYSIPLNKKIFFQPELLLAWQGLDYDINLLYAQITYQIRINYLQVPLLFFYKTAREKKTHPGFFIGQYAAFMLKAIKEDDSGESWISSVRPYDFGLIGGVSMDFAIRSRKLSCELRTSYGLTNMMDRIEGYIPWYYGPEKEKARNISITAMVGYSFSKEISRRE